MYFQNDWIMRQIEMMTKFVMRLIFDRETADEKLEEIIENSGHELVWSNILAALRAGEVDKAENMLFENADPEDEKFVAVGLDFYKRLAGMTDEELKAADFSREEILDGLNDFLKIYRIDMDENKLV